MTYVLVGFSTLLFLASVLVLARALRHRDEADALLIKTRMLLDETKRVAGAGAVEGVWLYTPEVWEAMLREMDAN